MAALIADDGSRIIQQQIDTKEQPESNPEFLAEEALFDDYFDVVEVSNWILQNDYRRVALQFPDHLLVHSWRLSKRLREIMYKAAGDGDLERVVFILGDTSYGSCCVDDVGAQHNHADCIVHIGPACMSPTNKIPVAFVYGKQNLDPSKLVEACSRDMSEYLEHQLIVLYDQTLEHQVEIMRTELQKVFKTCVLSSIHDRFRSIGTKSERGQQCKSETTCCSSKSECNSTEGGQAKDACCSTPVVSTDTSDASREENESDDFRIMGQTIPAQAIDNKTAVFLCIGSPSSSWMSQVQLRFNQFPVYISNPFESTLKCSPLRTGANRVLARRYFLMDTARNSSIVGILVGTMSVRGYGQIIERIREQVRQSGRKSYTFMMGKINPQKLANFAEIDVFVLVACPLNSLIDSKEFYKPIVTPMELEIALGHKEWVSEYTADFQQVLDSFKSEDSRDPEPNEPIEEGDSPAPHFSMATGGMVQIRRFGQEATEPNQVPVSTSETSALTSTNNRKHIAIRYSSPAAELLSERSYQGLDPAIGKTKPEPASLGQTGIASGLGQFDGVNLSTQDTSGELR